MNDQEKKEFCFDVKVIDWRECEINFVFGIRRFFLKEDILAPEANFKQILAKDQIKYFEDVRLTIDTSKNIVYRSNQDYFSDILSHDRFNAFLEQKSHMRKALASAQPVSQSKSKGSKGQKKNKNAMSKGKEASSLTFNLENARNQLEEMQSDITSSGVRMLMYLFNKNMRRSI